MIWITKPGPLKYVDRGDLDAYDFVTGNFTFNNAWHALDLSSIIPASTKLVMLNVDCSQLLGAALMQFSTNGADSDKNVFSINSYAITQVISNAIPIVPTLNRTIYYKGTACEWPVMNVNITGWFK